jgi:K+-sensing histidine kinase KdpD
MSVVRYILERHGGTLGLVMDTHLGPRFYFELPLHRNDR